jgi:Ser/Thr protein kinase RdoA (MazF antagonist)
MEKEIKDRYSDTVLHEAMARYNIAEGTIQLLDGFESFMYEFERGSSDYILRIAHSLRRTVPLIHGEVDWINYLAEGGASVARAIPSANGNLVEPIEDGQGGQFLATAFVKAAGGTPSRAEWTPQLFEQYGQLLGRMHALSKVYTPSNPAWRRHEWDDPLMLVVEDHLPASEGKVVERYSTLKAHLDTLPRGDREEYGLIHQDAHAGNFFVDEEGTITLFDFDDCAYSWFANDIAIVLFYAVMWADDASQFSEEFLTHFLRGYRRENSLAAEWLQEIPHFLKLREIDLYAVIHRSFDVENLDDPWCAWYMAGRKERIESGLPYVDFDFTSLAFRQ